MRLAVAGFLFLRQSARWYVQYYISLISLPVDMDQHFGSFVWDARKETANIRKHGIDFETAAHAFKDPARKIYADEKHGASEERLFCIGQVEGKILTVRFTHRDGLIRIYGAGYWRNGRRYYEAGKG